MKGESPFNEFALAKHWVSGWASPRVHFVQHCCFIVGIDFAHSFCLPLSNFSNPSSLDGLLSSAWQQVRDCILAPELAAGGAGQHSLLARKVTDHRELKSLGARSAISQSVETTISIANAH